MKRPTAIPMLLLAVTVLAPGTPLLAQSTCACDAAYLAGQGARTLGAVNPAWSTCGCPMDALAAVTRPVRNTRELRMARGSSRSLPAEEYELAMAERNEMRRARLAELRAASRTPLPRDPLSATGVVLRDKGPQGSSYRAFVEEGALVLRGEVPTVYDRLRAEELAREASTLPVRSQLRVTSLGQISDEQIAMDVERTLRDEGLAARSVAVHRGEVVVTPSLALDETTLLLQLPGVRAVR